MRQYIFLLLNNITLKIGDAIDAGFANSISLGVICVFAILGSMHTFLVGFYEYGGYYFRVYNCRAKAGFILNLLVSVFASILIISCVDFIGVLYYIEHKYEELLRRCVLVAFSYFPIEAGVCYLRDTLVYCGKERWVSTVNFIFYCTLIPLDVVAVLLYKSAELVLAGTGVSYLISYVLLFWKAPYRKERFKFEDLRIVIIDGFPMFYNRLLSKISMLLINVFGSRLGTVYYATLAISRKSLESAQLCLQPILPVIITKFRDCANIKIKDILNSIRSILAIGLFSYFVMGYIIAFMCKGDLDIVRMLICVTAVNTVSVFSYVLYIACEAGLSVLKLTESLKKSGTIRICVTIAMCVVAYIFNDSFIGLLDLMLYSCLTDTITGLYSYIVISRNAKN